MDVARLAGVTCLDLAPGRGPRVAYVFDPHRLALGCWAHALWDGAPAALLTLDRHADLLPPLAMPPHRAEGVRALDEHARWSLRSDNTDHVLAAVEAGLLESVVSISRTRLPGGVDGTYRDQQGKPHGVHVMPTVELLATAWNDKHPPPGVSLARHALESARRIVLDIDLDAFTTPSDADPTDVVPWPAELVRAFLVPSGSGVMWDQLLARCVAVTLACEPAHCGGLVAGGRLFETVATVLFKDLLGVDVP